jgi:outer membrane protein
MKYNTNLRGMRLAALAACVSVSAICAPAAAQAQTLADALVGAYTQSGLLDQNRALLRIADEDVAIAGALLKPIISWSADATRRFGDATTTTAGFTRTQSLGEATLSMGITATLQLYDGGADVTRVEAAKESVLATRAALLTIEQNVLLRAAVAFFNVGRQQEFVALRRNNLDLLNEELRAAQDRFEVGEVTRTDVALAEAAVAQARSNLAASQRDLVQAQAEYTSVVGRAPGRLAAVPRLPTTESNVETAQGVAVRNHPEMIRAKHEVAANELLLRSAGLDMLPTISLSGSLNLQETYSSDDNTQSGSVSLSAGGPIYRGGELSARERRAFALRDASRGNQHNVRRGVQQDVAIAVSNLVAARASLAASERQISAARIAFSGVREEATLGARTTLDVLDAEQDLLDAEANGISAQADQYIATYQVLESMGLLTAQRLGLPVQIYDPVAYYNLVKDGPAKRSRQGQQLDRVIRALDVTD